MSTAVILCRSLMFAALCGCYASHPVATEVRVADGGAARDSNVDAPVFDAEVPDANDAIPCLDQDGDGFGTGCRLGDDCDDTDATRAERCPAYRPFALVGCEGGTPGAEAIGEDALESLSFSWDWDGQRAGTDFDATHAVDDVGQLCFSQHLMGATRYGGPLSAEPVQVDALEGMYGFARRSSSHRRFVSAHPILAHTGDGVLCSG